MEYLISRELRRLSVCGESDQYYFKNKLFSLSSSLTDQNENKVASLKRKSWWNLSFILVTPKGNYYFKNNALDSTLTCTSTNENFHTHGSANFHTMNGKPITKISRYKGDNLRYVLTIHNHEHKIAFIIASCIFYRTTLEPAHAAYAFGINNLQT